MWFGIEDKTVAWAYILCIASALICVVWGVLNWNKGDDHIEQEDIRWAQEEKKAEQEL